MTLNSLSAASCELYKTDQPGLRPDGLARTVEGLRRAGFAVCLVEPSGQGKTGRRNAQHRSEQRLVPDGAFGPYAGFVVTTLNQMGRGYAGRREAARRPFGSMARQSG